MRYLYQHLVEQSLFLSDEESHRLELERQGRPWLLELVEKQADERRQAETRKIAAGYFHFDGAEEYLVGAPPAAAEVD